MSAMITDIETYFEKGCGRCPRFDTADCTTQVWASGLARLRDICRGTEMGEEVKWVHPCYTHAGRNIAIIGATRGDFRLSFLNAALMQDPEGVLERHGPHTAHPDMIRFTDAAAVTPLAPTITTYLEEAMGYAAAGLRPPRDEGQPDWPEELIDALDADPALAQAFHGLTPGRQKSYVLNLRGAKQPGTRTRRLAAFRDRIFAGKGATERWPE